MSTLPQNDPINPRQLNRTQQLDKPRPAGKPRKGRNQDVSVAVKAILWLTVILVGGLGVLYLVSKAGDLMGKGF